MSEVPENNVTQEDLQEWYNLQVELGRIKSKEALLRAKIFKHFFPAPVEGTNNHPLEGGYVLKGKHNINRNVDVATLQAMRDQFEQAGIVVDSIVEWKPSVRMREYRQLTAEELKLFDQCLIVKPGAPALEIVLPKRAARASNNNV